MRLSSKNDNVFFHASFDSSGAYLSPDGFANAWFTPGYVAMSFWIPTASDDDSKSFTVAGGIPESAALVRVMIMGNSVRRSDCVTGVLRLEYLLFFQKAHLRHCVTRAETNGKND